MTQKPKMREREFIVLMAFAMSLVALSIDTILPALPLIAESLDETKGNGIQQVVSFLFLGLTVGQLFFGPIADRLGRKPALAMGIFVFMVGSLVSAFASDFSTVLAGRLVQGFGVAAMRIVAVAIIRDKYEGASMARIMSLAMSIFILVPCVAPLLGQGILAVADWRAIFWVLLTMSGVLAVWFWIRQPETLDPAHRAPAGLKSVWAGVHETCSNRTVLWYTISLGLVQGGFVGYLLSAEQIFHQTYQTGDLFAIYFAILALSIGLSSLVNARIVERFGTQKICRVALMATIAVSIIALLGELLGSLSLTGFLVAQAGILFCLGLMFGNMNAIAMHPLGHIAGVASAVISFIKGLLGLVVGSLIGAAFDLTVFPLLFGVFSTSVATLLVVTWTDSPQSKAFSETSEISGRQSG